MWEPACRRLWGSPTILKNQSRERRSFTPDRLLYGYPGQRLIGYDNERPKGDHRHFRETEEPYDFSTPEQLIDDFLADIANERKTP